MPILFLLLALFLCPNFSFAEDLSFQYKISGHVYDRHILTEGAASGSTLLLVVDNDPLRVDDQSTLSQTLVLRKLFSASQSTEFDEAIKYFSRLDSHKLDNFMPPLAGRPLWVAVKDSWSLEDEADYSKWFSEEVDPNFVVGSGLDVDCANFAIAVRWVYARNHHLPMAITLAGSRTLFGHFSSNADWDKLPEDADWKKDKRFKAALKYVLENTYTHSLFTDLYPTLINSNYVRSGSVFIFLRPQSGHTQIIKSVGPCPGCPLFSAGSINVYYANEPASEEIYSMPLVYPEGPFTSPKTGFKMWRWPEKVGSRWQLMAPEKMPGYSLEQYAPPILNSDDHWAYMAWVIARLGFKVTDEDFAFIYSRQLAEELALRLQLTSQAYIYCTLKTCPPGSREHEDYSTPTRDARMIQTQNEFADAAKRLGPENPMLKKLKELYTGQGQLPMGAQPKYKSLLVGDDLTFWGYITNAGNILQKLNSEAQASFSDRWGLGSRFSHDDQVLISDASIALGLLEKREGLIFQALSLCFKQGDDVLSCDPVSSEISPLNTLDIDHALRSLATELRSLTLATKLTPGVLASAKDTFDRPLINTAMSLCSAGEDPGYVCSMNALLLNDLGFSRLQNWTSAASDHLAARWGFKPTPF
jgi:hypothetical protein